MSNFYKNQVNFEKFNQFLSEEFYQDIPSDWWVFITDIKGSTKAVESGKFRDVNFVGALGITAVLNEISEPVPFVFGGDGATISVPSHLKEKAMEALRKSIYISRTRYNLELRVGMISVQEIIENNVFIKVAKYKLSDGNFIAQFKGGGINFAEKRIKSFDKYLLKEIEELPDLTGLSCRWEPVVQQKGTILTLIVQSKSNNKIYSSIINEIESILNSEIRSASPVKVENLLGKFPPKTLNLEAKAGASKSNYLKFYFKTLLMNLIGYIVIKNNLDIKGFSTNKYKKEIVLNSDFKKFDDTLRLVIDCSNLEAQTIINKLSLYEKEKQIYFGYHLSESAVLTCFVKSTDSDHLHFIDGSGGGYTLSSKQIKNKIKGDS